MVPEWLDALAKASVTGSFFIAGIIIGAVWVRPQKMWIMNVVWPVTALYWGPVTLWAYRLMGLRSAKSGISDREEGKGENRREDEDQQSRSGAQQIAYAGQKPADRHQRSDKKQQEKPFWQSTAVGVTHCGAGCTLGDIAGEWMVYAFGWKLFGDKIYAEYFVDFGLAFTLGIVFQYFSIAPMRGLGLKDGIVAALKADTISIVAFEIGLFGWMALTGFVLFPQETADSWNHWYMMQIGMIIGFFTSYPANWFLLRRGLKEAM